MITGGGRAAIFIVFGSASLLHPLHTATATTHVNAESNAQSSLAEALPIPPSTAGGEPEPSDDHPKHAAADHEAALRQPDSTGALGPINESGVPPTGMRDLFSGMAIGGGVVLVVWAMSHWLRGRGRTRSRADRDSRRFPAPATIDTNDAKRLAARTETLARLEIAETAPGSVSPSREGQTDSEASMGPGLSTPSACARAALLGEAPPAGTRRGNGMRWTERVLVEQPSSPPASIESLLENWSDAFRHGNLDACRRAMTALVGRIEATTAAQLREKTERMSDELETRLRERFSACVRDSDYRGALAVGSQIKRHLPASSIAADFERIHPYLIRRIERTPT